MKSTVAEIVLPYRPADSPETSYLVLTQNSCWTRDKSCSTRVGHFSNLRRHSRHLAPLTASGATNCRVEHELGYRVDMNTSYLSRVLNTTFEHDFSSVNCSTMVVLLDKRKNSAYNNTHVRHDLWTRVDHEISRVQHDLWTRVEHEKSRVQHDFFTVKTRVEHEKSRVQHDLFTVKTRVEHEISRVDVKRWTPNNICSTWTSNLVLCPNFWS